MYMSDLKSFLNELKQLNEKDCFTVYVPSVDRKVKFKSLSVKQHKDIVKAMLGGMEGTILTSKIFNDIITENSSEKLTFKYYDRNKILVDIRQQSVGNKVKIDDRDYLLTDLPTFKLFTKPEAKFTYKGITVTVDVPTLDIDSTITEKSVIDIAKISADEKKVGESINILLTYEILKFIQTIEIEGNILTFSELGTYDKKNIIENLPLKLNNDILEYITDYKELEQEQFTYSDGVKLEINGSFLTSE
jgi:hypothetical protein